MKTSYVEVRQLLRQIQDAGLSVSNVANSLDWEGNISARGPSKRDAAICQDAPSERVVGA
jgi:hypothetical protein